MEQLTQHVFKIVIETSDKTPENLSSICERIKEAIELDKYKKTTETVFGGVEVETKQVFYV